MAELDSPISADEARAALDTIRQVELQTRRAIGLGGGGAIMIVWGLVWMVGFLGGHWLGGGPVEGAIWAVVDTLGLIGTAIVVSRFRHRVRDGGGGRRIGLFWMMLFLFIGLVLWLAQPLSEEQFGLLISILVMFGYVTMGVFVDRLFLWVGLAVTALAVVGYVLLPAHFNLWMGILGGGTIFGSGIYVHRRWR